MGLYILLAELEASKRCRHHMHPPRPRTCEMVAGGGEGEERGRQWKVGLGKSNIW